MNSLISSLQRLSEAYNQFRASYWAFFLTALGVLIAALLHFTLGSDPRWEDMNTVLTVSTELNTILAIVHNSRAEKNMLHLLQAMRAILEREGSRDAPDD